MAVSPVAESLILEPDDFCLAGQRWGNHDAPLILALHGWLDNSNSFAPLAPYLVQNGYQLLALDWPGHGYSHHRSIDNHYQFLDYLFDLQRVMTHLPESPHCLLGHSMGGILAQLFAGVYPEMVNHVAAIEALGPLVDEPGEALSRLRRGFAMRRKHRCVDGDVDLESLIRARAESNALSYELAESLMLRSMEQRQGRWYWRSDPRLRQRSAWMMTASQAKQYLSGWTGSSLLLLAEDGYPQLKSALVNRQTWFGDIQVRTVAGGHHCHMTSPESVAAELAKYLV